MPLSAPLMMVVAAAGVLAASGGSAPVQPAQGRLLEAMIRSSMRRHRIVGMSAVAVMNGSMVLSAGYGFADRSRRIPVTPQSVFPLGSVTGLEQPGEGAGRATVRQLLTHHGGLPGNHMNPHPSSLTSRRVALPWKSSRIRTDWARACLSALLSTSWATWYSSCRLRGHQVPRDPHQVPRILRHLIKTGAAPPGLDEASPG